MDSKKTGKSNDPLYYYPEDLKEPVKTWYEKNSQEIKLIQYLLYHLKQSGHIIETKHSKHQKVPEISEGVSIEHGEFTIQFE